MSVYSFRYFYTLLIGQYRNKRNVFYQQGREIVILIHESREKVTWTGGRKKANGVESQGPRPGAVGRGKIIP